MSTDELLAEVLRLPRPERAKVAGSRRAARTHQVHVDANREGTRFTMNRYVEPVAVPPLHIVLHATAGDSQPLLRLRGAARRLPRMTEIG